MYRSSVGKTSNVFFLSKTVFSSGGEEKSDGVERSVTIIPHLGGQESRCLSLSFLFLPNDTWAGVKAVVI